MRRTTPITWLSVTLRKGTPSWLLSQFEAAIALGLDPMIGLYERWKTWMLLGEFERAWQETDRIESERRRGSLQVDLVLTVDTMIAHLAGALGKPVWVLLHFDSDWRWMLDRFDSPWYPTMRLFRQRSPGDWLTPINEVTDLMAKWAHEHR